MSSRAFWCLFAGILIIGACLLFFRLGSNAFIDYDEASYASIIDSTVISGDLSVPRMLNTPMFDKPPLYYWAAMASGAVFGRSEFAYRLPAVLAALGAIALVMLITLESSDNRTAALAAGLILLTSAFFFEAARQLRFDVPVSAFMLLSVYGYVRGRSKPAWYLAIAIGIGLGIMTKSVIGLFAIPAIVVWSAAVSDWRWLRSGYTWSGAAAGAAIVLPWHMRETILFGRQFWDEYVVHTIFQRVSSDIFLHPVSRWFLFREFIWTTLPWGIAMVIPIIRTLKSLRSKATFAAERAAAPSILTLGMFVFFTLSQTTLLYYFIPVIPFMAIAIGISFGRMAGEWQADAWLVWVGGAVALCIACSVVYWVGYDRDPDFASWSAIANEERAAGLAIAHEPQGTLYFYKYPYAETLRYYSGNRAEAFVSDLPPEGPGVLVMNPQDVSELPKSIVSRLSPIFEGDVLVVRYR